MDGYEGCARLEEKPEIAAIPLIFITSRSETVDKTRAFEMGAVDYITKFFHAAEVKARVQTRIALKEMKSRLQTQLSIASLPLTAKLGSIPC